MERSKKKPRILVVDDHEDNIELLRARLEARGYEVDGANDGQQALEQVDKICPDLILLDVMMPKMDGMEVVRRLKAKIATKELPFIPVIMQTALDSTENKVEGLDAGADDYITKPINFAELEARVNSLLRIKGLQSDLALREKELSELNDKLRQISLTDGLTQIENRRSLEDRLHDMWQHSVRLHEPLALVMCDIDKFKSVNDHYGHQAGDSVLKEFAQLLKAEAREIDRVGRDVRRAAAGEGGAPYFYICRRHTLPDHELRRGGLAPSTREGSGSAIEGVGRRSLCGQGDWAQPSHPLRWR